MKRASELLMPEATWISNSNPFKHIESVGRVCYKSEDMITDTSCYPFVLELINNSHFAMLEHVVFHFRIAISIPDTHFPSVPDLVLNIPNIHITQVSDREWILTCSMSHLFNPKWDNQLLIGLKTCIEAEYQLMSHGFQDAGSDLEYPCTIDCGRCIVDVSRITALELESWIGKDSRYHITYSCKFICDRGVSHELVRHRVSFAQESTRYCNYNTDRFDHSISYIKPSTWDTWDDRCKMQFLEDITACETIYKYMVYRGLAPEQARTILPHCLKTEIVMTATVDQWEHFFDLRYRGLTGDPHPDMKALAQLAMESCPFNE